MRGKAIEQQQRVEIEEILERLAKPVTEVDLAHDITKLLNSLGRKVDRIKLAHHLAAELAPRFVHKSNDLQRLVTYRPQELAALVQSVFPDEIQREILPMINAQKKKHGKITTKNERLRQNKRAKNRYELLKRNHIPEPGLIERDFSKKPILLSLDPSPPTGPWLDEIFRGGSVKMCGNIHSLQSLFGLSRKILSAGKPAIQRGRETFYNYENVLTCMDVLLKDAGPSARWLPNPAVRRTVLTGILFRAEQQARVEIHKAFEKTLLPYLN
jgi:hypothetical protein